MDITILFKACVKTVKATNKSLGIKEQKTSLNRAKDPHLCKAMDVLKQISRLKNFLLENKAAYLNVINYLSTNKTMSELDREQIDAEAEKIVASCSQLISDFKRETAHIDRIKSAQREEHYRHVADSLEAYLKEVSRIYTEAKAVRVKRVIETHRLSKLETTPPRRPPTDAKLKDSGQRESVKVAPPSGNTPVDYDEQLSAEEMQMFESENELLFSELNSLSDEVKQMEGKVVHIAELQEMFTEKVLQQEKDIERIAATVANSTDNMRDANEQIRQAIQRNAGLRVWILFFLLVMSFSLLFLDWYND